MSEIASKRQLWASFGRWAVVTVPGVLLLGFLSASLAPLGSRSAWYASLAKPGVTPPDWLFPIAWTLLYAAMGLALAMILNARGARGRGLAIAAFAAQLVVNLVWSPLFFGAHQVTLAVWVIAAMLLMAILATVAFGRIRAAAAWLLVPYLVWISFAGVLNWRIDQLNPEAEHLVPGGASTQISL